MTTNNTERLIGNPNATADWCDDCHGYTHMPYCPHYEQPDKLPCDTNDCERPECHRCWPRRDCERLSTEQAGGDEWRVEQRQTRAVVINAATSEDVAFGCGNYTSERLERAGQIVTEHNQHARLVAERDALQAALAEWESHRAGLIEVVEAGERRVQELEEVLGYLVAADNCNYDRDTMRSEGLFDAARAALHPPAEREGGS